MRITVSPRDSGRLEIDDTHWNENDLYIAPGITVDGDAVPVLRSRLAAAPCPRCADLSADALEVARIERELCDALETAPQGYFGFALEQQRSINHNQFTYVLHNHNDTKDKIFRGAAARLEAARAAAEFVRGLRKPELPEPEEMRIQEVTAELNETYHCEMTGNFLPKLMWIEHHSDWYCIQSDVETPVTFHRRALRLAREEAANANR